MFISFIQYTKVQTSLEMTNNTNNVSMWYSRSLQKLTHYADYIRYVRCGNRKIIQLSNYSTIAIGIFKQLPFILQQFLVWIHRNIDRSCPQQTTSFIQQIIKTQQLQFKESIEASLNFQYEIFVAERVLIQLDCLSHFM